MKKIIKKLYFLCHYIRLRVRIFAVTQKNGSRVWLLGTPIHNNIGDLAIMKAEIEFIRQVLPQASIIEIPMPFLLRLPQLVGQFVKNDDMIVGHGGGNFGDTYEEEETCRRILIEKLPDNKIILFPQTAHFSDSEAGRAELAKSVAIYSRHQDLTLIAREETSYVFMQEHFKNNKILLTPDIVLSMSPKLPLAHRDGALTCIRDDVESALLPEEREALIDWVRGKYSDVCATDTIARDKLFLLKPRNWVVISKLREFSRAEFVLTDRLHGMVLAAITGTPCIALTNFNHKVKGTYRWIEKLPYVYFCDDMQALDDIYNRFDFSKIYTYDPDMHKQYWKKIAIALDK